MQPRSWRRPAPVGSYGTFAIDGAGAWTYTASSAHNAFVAGTTYTDTFSVASADGTPTSVTINIARQQRHTGSECAEPRHRQGHRRSGDAAGLGCGRRRARLRGPERSPLGISSGSGENRTYKPDPGYVGSDSFSYVANDGTLDSAPASVSLNVHLNIAPVVTAFDQSAARGQVFNASDLFSATDGDGDTLLYFFYDNSADPASGHFTVNGVVQAANTTFAVNAAQLAQTTFTAGQLPDDLFVNAWDFSLYSGPQEFHINVPVNRAPTATAPRPIGRARAGVRRIGPVLGERWRRRQPAVLLLRQQCGSDERPLRGQRRGAGGRHDLRGLGGTAGPEHLHGGDVGLRRSVRERLGW